MSEDYRFFATGELEQMGEQAAAYARTNHRWHDQPAQLWTTATNVAHGQLLTDDGLSMRAFCVMGVVVDGKVHAVDEFFDIPLGVWNQMAKVPQDIVDFADAAVEAAGKEMGI